MDQVEPETFGSSDLIPMCRIENRAAQGIYAVTATTVNPSLVRRLGSSMFACFYALLSQNCLTMAQVQSK